MKKDFREGIRPAPSQRPRGGRPRSAAVDAVLATEKTGRAIFFPNEKRARTVRFTTSTVLKRERPELVARRSELAVWVEPRVKARVAS